MFKSIKRYFDGELKKGVPGIRAFSGVPRHCAVRLSVKLAALINDQFINRSVNVRRFGEFQRRYGDRLSRPFFVIVMPDSLHFLNPCLSLIPPEVEIVLIPNGIRKWEERYLAERCGRYLQLRLAVFPASRLSHGSILTLLMAHSANNFGIMDHDLYCFNKGVFGQLDFKADEFVIGAIKRTNAASRIEFPTTHFLFFNIALVQYIMKKYNINARVYKRIPSRLKDKLLTLGLGNHNFLKENLPYFDTLNLILAMAFYEKLSVGFLDYNAGDLYHIGGTSYGKDDIQLRYISLQFLKLPHNQDLRLKYASLIANQTSVYQYLVKSFSGKSALANFIGNTTFIIRKISQNA